jgi:hypothetical protein
MCTESVLTTHAVPQMLLLASTDGDTFRTSLFPQPLNVQSQITILDSTDALICALYLGQPYADVFVSDAVGVQYTLMINRVRRIAAHTVRAVCVADVYACACACQPKLRVTRRHDSTNFSIRVACLVCSMPIRCCYECVTR